MQGTSENIDNKPKVTGSVVVVIDISTGSSMSRWGKKKDIIGWRAADNFLIKIEFLFEGHEEIT